MFEVPEIKRFRLEAIVEHPAGIDGCQLFEHDGLLLVVFGRLREDLVVVDVGGDGARSVRALLVDFFLGLLRSSRRGSRNEMVDAVALEAHLLGRDVGHEIDRVYHVVDTGVIVALLLRRVSAALGRLARVAEDLGLAPVHGDHVDEPFAREVCRGTCAREARDPELHLACQVCLVQAVLRQIRFDFRRDLVCGIAEALRLHAGAHLLHGAER